MRRLIFWVTIASGLAAVYLLMQRGESFGEAAGQAVQNPFGSLANALKQQ